MSIFEAKEKRSLSTIPNEVLIWQRGDEGQEGTKRGDIFYLSYWLPGAIWCHMTGWICQTRSWIWAHIFPHHLFTHIVTWGTGCNFLLSVLNVIGMQWETARGLNGRPRYETKHCSWCTLISCALSSVCSFLHPFWENPYVKMVNVAWSSEWSSRSVKSSIIKETSAPMQRQCCKCEPFRWKRVQLQFRKCAPSGVSDALSGW